MLDFSRLSRTSFDEGGPQHLPPQPIRHKEIERARWTGACILARQEHLTPNVLGQLLLLRGQLDGEYVPKKLRQSWGPRKSRSAYCTELL